MSAPVTVTLLVRLPDGDIHDIGHIQLDTGNLRDSLATALEDAATQIRHDGLADGH